MKIGQYCQRQRCRHVELEQFWQAFASRGFVSDSWAFLLSTVLVSHECDKPVDQKLSQKMCASHPTNFIIQYGTLERTMLLASNLVNRVRARFMARNPNLL